ncbi:MAG: energy transducer TonB [Candidatus Eisenbacteria bacterium]
MQHGIDAYFAEQKRSKRRFALASGLVTMVALFFMVALRGQAVRHALEQARRFGFEGPEQWVERIRLEEIGAQERAGTTTYELVFEDATLGGEANKPVPSPPRGGTVPRRMLMDDGPGAQDRDLLARARALRLEGPVILSDQLIAERIVRPEYPDDAIDHDIEGIVELVALVDTTGAVVEVQILKSSHPLLEKAAIDAIVQCRYRPFRLHEQTLRTWAAFRYAFSLYAK